MQSQKISIRAIAIVLAMTIFAALPVVDAGAMQSQTSFIEFFVKVVVPVMNQLQKLSELFSEGGGAQRVGISAGHGGNTGASVVVNGTRIYEDGKNLAIARAVNKEFSDRGYNTLMNRNDNSRCDKDTKLALYGAYRPTMLLEFHYNIGGGKAEGLEVWYKDGCANGKRLAEILAARLSASAGLRNRGAKSDKNSPGGSFYICQSFPLAVLIECAFLDNPNDVRKLDSASARQRFAKAALDAVEEFWVTQK